MRKWVALAMLSTFLTGCAYESPTTDPPPAPRFVTITTEWSCVEQTVPYQKATWGYEAGSRLPVYPVYRTEYATLGNCTARGIFRNEGAPGSAVVVFYGAAPDTDHRCTATIPLTQRGAKVQVACPFGTLPPGDYQEPPRAEVMG